MNLALDTEQQTPVVSSTPDSAEKKSEHYILGHAWRGGCAGKRRGVPAIRAGQGGAYAVASWFRQQGFKVFIRSEPDTMPPDLLAWSSDELVLVLIRRTRLKSQSLHAIADLYREELCTFRSLSIFKEYHRSYQFWLSVPYHGWRVFEVTVGGIREITGDL
jgi:hypothetical protein